MAVHLAANRPDRFKGLILTGVPLLKREARRKSPIAFPVGAVGGEVGTDSRPRRWSDCVAGTARRTTGRQTVSCARFW